MRHGITIQGHLPSMQVLKERLLLSVFLCLLLYGADGVDGPEEMDSN